MIPKSLTLRGKKGRSVLSSNQPRPRRRSSVGSTASGSRKRSSDAAGLPPAEETTAPRRSLRRQATEYLRALPTGTAAASSRVKSLGRRFTSARPSLSGLPAFAQPAADKPSVFWGKSPEQMIKWQEEVGIGAAGGAGMVPAIFIWLIDWLETHEDALVEEGLFRQSARREAQLALRAALEEQPRNAEAVVKAVKDVHLIARTLISLLAELPEEGLLLPRRMHDALVSAAAKGDRATLRSLLATLPPARRGTLVELLAFFRRFCSTNSHLHRMTVHNMAIILGPNLLRPPAAPSSQSLSLSSLGDVGGKRVLVEEMLNGFDEIFCDGERDVEEEEDEEDDGDEVVAVVDLADLPNLDTDEDFLLALDDALHTPKSPWASQPLLLLPPRKRDGSLCSVAKRCLELLESDHLQLEPRIHTASASLELTQDLASTASKSPLAKGKEVSSLSLSGLLRDCVSVIGRGEPVYRRDTAMGANDSKRRQEEAALSTAKGRPLLPLLVYQGTALVGWNSFIWDYKLQQLK